jgi:glycosyltransferase involved in cell wall biosynthesis
MEIGFPSLQHLSGPNMCVSVLILTLNEEVNLPGCLESVAWSDDIVVFDSYSSDSTVEIAKAAGARVLQRVFDNYAGQRNAALNGVQYKHPWVLMVDADERWPGEMYEEMLKAISSDGDMSIYHFRRRDMFMGRWLRHTGYPTWAGRLVKVGRVQVQRGINEEYHTSGRKGYLQGHFIHYPFNKGIAYWIHRHNRYSSMEAEAIVREAADPPHLKDAFSRDPTRRRKFLKQLAYRLPCRPLLVFCYLYLVQRGFLDGVPGLTYCRLRMSYEYLIDLKITELRRRARGLPV